MQFINASTVNLIGYASASELVVLRRPSGLTQVSVFVGNGAVPLENLFQQKESRDVLSSGTYGLLGKCDRDAYTLSGGAELVFATPPMGRNRCTYSDGQTESNVLSLPASHFEFCLDDQGQLVIDRKAREIKYSGTIKQGSTDETVVIITGLMQQPLKEWARSAEIFAGPYGSSVATRLHVNDITTERYGTQYRLRTALGTLEFAGSKSLFGRTPSLVARWNSTLITADSPQREGQIRDPEGIIL